MDVNKVTFEGRVKHSEFLGYLVRYAVEIDGTDILVDDEHYMGRHKYEVGTMLRVALDQDKVRILPN